MKTFYEILNEFELPVEYGYISKDEKVSPPFLIYMSSQTDRVYADDKQLAKKRNYRLEYYFEDKNEELEDRFEKFLEDKGFIFSSSDDIYIDSEDIFVIYYEVEMSW